MPLINVVIILIIVGLVMWLVNDYILANNNDIRTLLNAIVVALVVLWLLQVFGVIDILSTARIET